MTTYTRLIVYTGADQVLLRRRKSTMLVYSTDGALLHTVRRMHLERMTITVLRCAKARAADIERRLRRLGCVRLQPGEEVQFQPRGRAPAYRVRRGSDRLWRALRGGG
jgi:hypothetical protein